nr:immunoglobulin light chain junction region [Macaca mulatta]MOV37029.1 immunoglobulin light chain junction region [Macaca mulatta]MOV37137.1 immunoglobulin light chain junction region [Macaca mulatta]MOV37155.1 immunoglobulin light chain junction region [Macaca mulatta]MOV37184.1 immunoglobulin light chain junction region [Macaca mulatta]
CLQYDSHPFTF